MFTTKQVTAIRNVHSVAPTSAGLGRFKRIDSAPNGPPAAQLDHVRGAVVALHAFPPWAFRPYGFQSSYLIVPLHDSLPRNIDQGPESGNSAGSIAINKL